MASTTPVPCNLIGAGSFGGAWVRAFLPAMTEAGRLRIVGLAGGVTVANHSDVIGLIGAAGVDDLRFAGSSLVRFMTAAFAGTLFPGCTQAIVNPKST